MTNKDYYYKRKWELMREIKKAFPFFPKVGINRKKKLAQLMVENEGMTLDEAHAWIVEQQELDKNEHTAV